MTKQNETIRFTRMDKQDSDLPLPPISVGIINYNGGEVLSDTIRGILKSDYPHGLEVLVVDDGSTDNSLQLVESEFPQISIHRQSKNMGPNAARNRVLEEASREIVFVTDNDVELAPDCLTLLVGTMIANPNCGVSTPMVLDFDKRDQVYSNGAELHYVCFGVLPLRHQTLPPDTDLSPRQTVCGSGGIMLVRKEMATAIGGFDEDFIFGYDDGEFTYRITLSGYEVTQIPAARIYHIEKEGRDPKRLRFQIKGRWSLILKTYSLRSLVLLAPVLVIFELSQIAFLFIKRNSGEWLQGWKLVIANWHTLMIKRGRTQKQKKRADKDSLCAGEIFMFPTRTGGGALLKIKKVMELFLNVYWTVISPFLTR